MTSSCSRHVTRVTAAALARALFASFALGAAGCGSSDASAGDGSFSASPQAVTTTDDGVFHVELRTSPDPPTRGTNQLELRVLAAASGDAVDGLTLTVVPWMPAMGHGASITPRVTPAGDGRYRVDDVSLFMPGHWELRTTIAGSAEDHATPAIDVP